MTNSVVPSLTQFTTNMKVTLEESRRKLEDSRIEAFIKDHPEFSDAPREWLLSVVPSFFDEAKIEAMLHDSIEDSSPNSVKGV